MARNDGPNDAFTDVREVIREGSVSRIDKESLEHEEDEEDCERAMSEIYDLDGENPEGSKDAFENLFSDVLDTAKGSLTEGTRKAYQS